MSNNEDTSELDAILDEMFDTSAVDAMKAKLWTMSSDDTLTNDELSFIADNILSFTREDLYRLPNIYIRGNTHYPIQLSCETATVLKMVASMTNTSLHAILPPFLKEFHCNCYCLNKNDGQVCTRKRRFGQTTCSRHIHTSSDVPQYVFKMCESFSRATYEGAKE